MVENVDAVLVCFEQKICKVQFLMGRMGIGTGM